MANGITEFCCRSGGSNLNAGTLQGDSTEPGTSASASYEYGDWDASTGVFTSNDNDPSSDGVAVGDYVSLHDEFDTATGFVGQVTAVASYEMTIDITDHYAGTIPSTSTGTVFAKVGGAWQGPNGAEGFPLDFVEDRMADGSDTSVRVNLKNDQTYAITAQITSSADHYRIFQGYTTNYADGGEAEIQGPATGTSFILWYMNAPTNTGNWWIDLFFNQNGDSAGSDWGVQFSAGSQRNGIYRCRFANMYRDGLLINRSDTILVDVESFDNGRYGIHNSGGDNIKMYNCYVHDNTSVGWYTADGQNRFNVMVGCVFANNGSDGCRLGQDSGSHIFNCVFYKNAADGLTLRQAATGAVVQDCAFFDNGGYGIDWGTSGDGAINILRNNAYGSGTQANTSGKYRSGANSLININDIDETADFNPWTDPDNGDFTLKATSSLEAAGTAWPFSSMSSTSRRWIVGASGPPAPAGSGASTPHPLRSTR